MRRRKDIERQPGRVSGKCGSFCVKPVDKVNRESGSSDWINSVVLGFYLMEEKTLFLRQRRDWTDCWSDEKNPTLEML